VRALSHYAHSVATKKAVEKTSQAVYFFTEIASGQPFIIQIQALAPALDDTVQRNSAGSPR
jgi:hypothetical protein